MNQRIIPVEIGDELKKSMLDYSMSTLVNRALPDVRDGLKPSQRRILVAMSDLNLGAGQQHRKCANIAGHTSGNYHPHGESIVYPTLVHLAQDFKMRYPLIDGQGNFGSIDGFAPAAMRYTEARMSGMGQELLSDIDKQTVNYQPNYDDRLEEPSVLPASFPNLLCNGAVGIATTMATAVPPNNLREVIDGMVALIDEPDLEVDDLMQFVKAPDFPTGGVIYGMSGVLDAYRTGRGHIRIRAKANIEESQDSDTIIITEIPYMVNKTALLEQIGDLVHNKTIESIRNIRDESDMEGLRIIVELKRDAVGDVVLNQSFKHTRLETTFAVNMIALVGGLPRQINLKQMMQCFIDHRHEVIERRTRYELGVAEDRAHVLEGLKIALDNIDEVIRVIRGSEDPSAARAALINQFELTERQAQAILAMTLQRLTSLEQQKIEDELQALLQEIERLTSILDSYDLRMDLVKEGLAEIREKYGDERRTEMVLSATEFNIEDLIAEEDVVITLSHEGYIKRISLASYKAQHRGGRGITGMQTKEEDFVESLFIASTHSYILILTDQGHCHWLKVHEVPEGTRQSRGRPVVNLIDFREGQKIVEVVPVREFDSNHYLTAVTQKGMVKKTSLQEYSRPRRGGIIAMKIIDGDQLLKAVITDGHKEIAIATAHGQAVRFQESKIRPMGRNSQGVRGVNLQTGDTVIGMVDIDPNDVLLTVCANGYGKRTPVSDYRLTNRGGKGVINIKTSERNGSVVAILRVTEDDDIVAITQNGILIRQEVNEITVIGRNTQGVRIINLDEGDQVIDVALAVKQDEEDGIEEGGNSANEDGASPDEAEGE